MSRPFYVNLGLIFIWFDEFLLRGNTYYIDRKKKLQQFTILVLYVLFEKMRGERITARIEPER